MADRTWVSATGSEDTAARLTTQWANATRTVSGGKLRILSQPIAAQYDVDYPGFYKKVVAAVSPDADGSLAVSVDSVSIASISVEAIRAYSFTIEILGHGTSGSIVLTVLADDETVTRLTVYEYDASLAAAMIAGTFYVSIEGSTALGADASNSAHTMVLVN